MKINKLELAALSRFFSSAVFRDLAKKGRSGLFRRLLDQTEIVRRCTLRATVGDAFDAAFDILKIAGQRDEYVYRAAISHKILMGTHSLRTASMLNEFRAGTCKADIVILNGTATAYEIKSERDSLSRLSNQIENYKKVFAKVNVIASEDHIESVLKTTPRDVGVLCLSKKYRISTEREALDNPAQICPTTVFESLRAVEATAILRKLGAKIPQVPNTQRHSALRALFIELDPTSLHIEMVRTLKSSRNLTSLSELVTELPTSLQAAALCTPVRAADHGRLIDAVKTPLKAAMAWS